ncbi:MAG: DUF721 domain-containing protein [Muribaculaceae bacterium]|nr:DUF721 domain-containing protein [Muribaculaceae bacterium]
MKRTEPKQIGRIIAEAMEHDGLTSVMAEQRACYVWPEIVGPGINRYTTRRYVERGVMHVYMTSAVLKNELSFIRSSLIARINRAVGSDVITQIIFH